MKDNYNSNKNNSNPSSQASQQKKLISPKKQKKFRNLYEYLNDDQKRAVSQVLAGKMFLNSFQP
jgi:hypothetical protein